MRKFEKTGSGYKVSETLDVDMKIIEIPKKIEILTQFFLSADLVLMSFSRTLRGIPTLKFSHMSRQRPSRYNSH